MLMVDDDPKAKNSKVAILGAGGVGWETFQAFGKGDGLDVVLCNRLGNGGGGRVQEVLKTSAHLDAQQAQLLGGTRTATHDLKEAIDGADYILLTAGLPRKNETQTREELSNQNAVQIVAPYARIIAEDYVEKARGGARETFPMVVLASNPVDCMTHLFYDIVRETLERAAQQASGELASHLSAEVSLLPLKIVGLGGAVDKTRLHHYAAEVLEIDPARISNPVVLGTHGPKMVPIHAQLQVDGQSYDDYCSQHGITDADARWERIVALTRNGGAAVIAQSGSATLTPGTALAQMVRSMEAHEPKRAVVSQFATLDDGTEAFVGQAVFTKHGGLATRLAPDDLGASEAEIVAINEAARAEANAFANTRTFVRARPDEVLESMNGLLRECEAEMQLVAA